MSTIRVDLQLDNGAFTAGIAQATQSLGQFNQRLAQSSQAYASLINRLQNNAGLRASLFNPQQIQQFQAAVANLSTTATNTGNSLNTMNTHSRGLLSTWRDLSIVFTAGSMLIGKIASVSNSWVGDIVRLNAQMERLNYQMRAMSGAADPIKDAADTITYLQEQAKEMPFSLKTITDSFVKMKSTGIDPMAGGLKALADGVAAAGGTDETLERATLAITQMSGKGVIQMEELRQQLGEAMPRAVELMARSMGVSMATLIKDIGRGTVEAKPALQAFFAEVERTYGGQALLMMQNFSGQIQRLQTSLQKLATTGTIKTNFYDGALREQLNDLNRFLQSDAATIWRDKLGNALTSAVHGLRWLLDTAIEFRGELGRLGAVLASVFTFRTAIAGISSFISFLRPTAENLAVLTARMQAFNAASATLAIRAQVGAPPMAQLGARLNVVGQAVRTGIAAFAAYAPLIGVAALAAFEAADYFGLLTNKTKDAYEALKQYGSESLAQAKRTTDARRAQLEKDVKDAEALAAADAIQNNGIVTEDIAKNLTDAKNALAAFNAETGGILDKVSDREAAKKLDDFKLTVEKKLGDISKVYDDNFKQFSDKWDKLEKEAAAKGESVEVVRADRQKATAEIERSYYDDRLKAIDDFLKQQKMILGKAEEADHPDDQFIKNMKTRIALLNQMAAETERIKVSLPDVGVPQVAKSLNEQKLYENGVENLKKMQAELAGLKETADGGYGAVVRLEQELNAGKYGPAGSPIVAALIKQTLEVKQQIEEQKELNKEIERKNRLYENGQDKLEKMKAEVNGLLAGMQGVNQDAVELRELAKSGFFGDQDTEKVKALATELEHAATAKSELDKLMKGKEKLDNDLESERIKLVERRLELEYKARGDELSDADKLKIKFQQGYYDGFGPASPTRQVLEAIVQSFDIQGKAAENVGRMVRENTFGDATVKNIEGVIEHLKQMLGILTGIGTAAGNIKFDNMGAPFSGANTPAGINNAALLNANTEVAGRTKTGIPLSDISTSNGLRTQVDSVFAAAFQGFLKDLEATGYQIKQLGGYNYRNIAGTNKLSNHATGDAIDINQYANPDTGRGGALITDMPPNIRELAAKWGLVWGGSWTSKKDSMHFEVSDALRAQAGAQMPSVPTPEVSTYQSSYNQLEKIWQDAQKNYLSTIDGMIAENDKLDKTEAVQNQAKYLKELKDKAEDAKRPVEELGKNYQDALEKIKSGGFGPKSSRDIGAPEYKEILEAAKQLDALDKQRNETLQARKQGETELKNLTEKEVELQKRAADAVTKYKNPDARVESDEYRKLEADLDQYVQHQKQAYGQMSTEAIQAEQFKQQQLSMLRGTESAELAAKYQKEARDIETSNMTQTQSRQVEMQRQIAQIDAEVAAFKGSEDQKVMLVAAAEKKKAAIRAQYAQQDPIGAKLKEWNDLQGNLETSAAGWMDSLSSGLADVIMGTGDLKQVISGIIHDLLNMGIKYLMSSLLQGAKGGKSGKTGAAAKTGTKAATGGKVGVAHTGGVIGASSLASRFVSGSVFKNAPKFHSGGFIGGMPKLKRGEVPIIAKEGEGVFTPEQMRALGKSAGAGSQVITINSPVTVNATGGTPEANADLARQVAKEHENAMRGLIRQEMFFAMKPGNILNSGH